MHCLNWVQKLANRWGIIGGRTSVRKRWLASFVLFVAIPMFIIIAFFIRYLIGQTEKDAAQFASRSLAQMKNNLYYRLDSVSVMASGLMLNLYDTLSQEHPGSLSRQYDDFSTMNSMFNSYAGRDMIDEMRLYVPDNRMYASQKDRFFPLSLLEDADRLRSYFSASRSILWLDTYERTRYYSAKSDLVVSCVSAFMSPNDFDCFAGVLFVDILESDLCALMQLGETNETVYLMNAQGTVLSHEDKHLIGTVIMPDADLKRVTAGDSGSFAARYGDQQCLLIYDRLDFPDWYLVSYIPRKYALSLDSASFMTRGTASLIGVLILMALGFSLMFSYILDVTITRVNRTVLKLEEQGLGGLSGRISSLRGSPATMWELEGNVESAISGVKTLLEENYAAQVKARGAQLKALQAQINPHFLYNTLDAIKWIVLDGEKTDAVWMVNALSRYFRLSLNKGRDIVVLQDEFDLVTTYLSIQQMRFEGGFVVKTDVDPSALDGLIPKLTLQPLVENALLHGIEEGGVENGEISISIRRSEQDVWIVIGDNGVGLSADTLRAVLSDQTEHKGYGLVSVHERLRLFFGEGCGLSVETCGEKGAKVKITMRYIRE